MREDTREYAIAKLARLVADATPPEAWVLIEGDGWSPRIPYLSHRRAFMVYDPVVSSDLVAGRPEIATLVCMPCTPKVIGQWPYRTWIGREAKADVFRVSAPSPHAGRE
jgi:hypothetical protein